MLTDFWRQAVEQAERVDKLPLLIVKRDRGQAVAFMPLDIVRRIVWRWAHEARIVVRYDDGEEGERVDRVCAVRWLELVNVDPAALYGLSDA